MTQLEVGEAQDWLGLPRRADPKLQTVIAAAERRLAREVGPIPSVALTVRVDGGSDALALPVLPVQSLTSVTPVVGGTAVNVADLRIDPEGAGLVTFTSGVRVFASASYDVAYFAGYDPDDFPPDLLLAVKEYVRHLWSPQKGAERRGGSGSSSEPDAAVTGEALPDRVEQLIAPYVLEELGFA